MVSDVSDANPVENVHKYTPTTAFFSVSLAAGVAWELMKIIQPQIHAKCRVKNMSWTTQNAKAVTTQHAKAVTQIITNMFLRVQCISPFSSLIQSRFRTKCFHLRCKVKGPARSPDKKGSSHSIHSRTLDSTSSQSSSARTPISIASIILGATSWNRGAHLDFQKPDDPVIHRGHHLSCSIKSIKQKKSTLTLSLSKCPLKTTKLETLQKRHQTSLKNNKTQFK